jgi:hypothetical protein
MSKLSSLRKRTGLITGILLLTLTVTAPLKSKAEAEPDPAWVPKLDDSQVFITYGELRRLTEQAAVATRELEPPPPPGPPVAACLTQVQYKLAFEQNTPQLSATFTAENLSSGWASVPLGAFHSAALDPVPPETRLARVDGQVVLILDKPGRAVFTLRLAPTVEGRFELHPPAQAALSSLEMAAPPAEHLIHLSQADGTSTRFDQAGFIHLSPDQEPLGLALARRDETPPAGLVQDTAIITEAVFQTQIAQDGAQLTSVTLRLEHAAATGLALTLPPGSEMLRCAVQGKPVPAKVGTEAGLQLSLPAPISKEGEATTTEVVFSYFLQGAALHSAEGELELSLPRSPLLLRRLDWTVELPEGLELTAQGNVELQAATSPQRHVLQLSRRLCRDNTTQARITYRKPNPTSNATSR